VIRRPAIDPTGVPGLDILLGGGLPRGGLVMIVGPPGSGKTTLAGHLAFSAARLGLRVLILTTLSESSTKLLGHLRTFTFYDEDQVGGGLRVYSLDQFLPDGLAATIDALRAIVIRERINLVVLDGFRTVGGPAAESHDVRRFLYELGSALGVQGTTLLVTSEDTPRDVRLFPEVTTADVLLGLHYDLLGMRHRRRIEAIKVRGGFPLPGLHPIELNESGARIYPRLETRIGFAPAKPKPESSKVDLGLAELNALLGGGVPEGTGTLVEGSLGTGKTLLALHFALAAVAAGKPAIYLSFRETEDELRRAMAAFELGPRLDAALLPNGGLTFQRQSPVEMDPDVVADGLLGLLDATGARHLVIDGVSELEEAVADGGDPRRLRNFLNALAEALRVRLVTSLILKETSQLLTADLEAPTDEIAVVADNIMLLQQLTGHGSLSRVLSVPKVRFSAHERRVRPFEIVSRAGIRVLADEVDGNQPDRTGSASGIS
jgi:circadian clock protein KaiC